MTIAKRGLWINRQWRVQKFEKAIEPLPNTIDDLEFLSTVLRDITGAMFTIPSVDEVRKVMSEKIVQLKDCAKVGALGKQIDGSAWSNIEFPEKNAMHFDAK